MKGYKILVKPTTKFTKNDWFDYIHAFNDIFSKTFDLKYFKNKYLLNSLGFSVHGILYHKDKIVGMVTVIPNLYVIKNKKEHIGLTCDTFILSGHRKNESFLKDMSLRVYEYLKKYNVKRHISLPNSTAYPYWKYFVKWKDIGNLNYYIIPLKISKIFPKIRFFDFITTTFFNIISFIYYNLIFFPNKDVKKKIRLFKNQEFTKSRYINNYFTIKMPDDISFTYKVYNEDGINVAYIIDCSPMTKRCFSTALYEIIKNKNLKIDMILFIGKITNPPFYFLKVPKDKEPRDQPFIGYSLIENDFEFFDIDNWEISLANFDNR